MNKILQINPPSAASTKAPDPSLQTKVIAITSGKGGVGKTNIASNLGIALASHGARVCIFDADTSLANINILMGLHPEYTLEHLLKGEKTIDEIILNGPKGVKIIPAASGIASYSTLNAQQQQSLLSTLTELEARFDYLLIDTAAGIGDTVLSFVNSAQYAILVVSPEPTALTDAFALLRSLKRSGFGQPVYVLVNMVQNYANSIEIFKRFETAVEKYLQTHMHYLGYIPEDNKIKQSVSTRTPVILQAPDSLSSRCFVTLAEVLKKQLGTTATAGLRFSSYWEAQLTTAPVASSVPAKQAAAGSDTSPEDFAMLGQRLLQGIQDTPLSQQQLRQLIGSLLEQYHHRFQELPLDDKTLSGLYAATPERTDAEFRDMIFSLESLYERRYHHPVRSLENRMLKLLADIEGSESLSTELIQQLRAAFGHQLCREILTSQDDFCDAIREIEPDKETLDALLKKLTDIYHSRFGEAPSVLTGKAVETLRTLVDRLDHQESQLEDSLIRMSKVIDDELKHNVPGDEDKD